MNNQNYGRLNPTPSARIIEPGPIKPKPARTKACLWLLLSGSLLIIATACGILVGATRRAHGPSSDQGPARVIRDACGLTQYPKVCESSLGNFPGAGAARDPREMAHISVKMTLERFEAALSSSKKIRNNNNSWEEMDDTLTRSAYEDCVELLEDSVEILAHSLLSVSLTTSFSSSPVDERSRSRSRSRSSVSTNQGGSKQQDVMTWLSAVMTNHHTCKEGFDDVDGPIKNQMLESVQDLSELVSNPLALYVACTATQRDGTSRIQNRRLLRSEPEYPKWMSRSERKLLENPTHNIQADITVAKDGSGNVKTITEAIKKAPQYSPLRFIILIKAGIYEEENLKVGTKKTNLWFIGEGKGRTVITGNKSTGHDHISTFRTAAFGAYGIGFVVRDITFVNRAGPDNQQAVALRVCADKAVVYHCEIKGYQDTLYVHSQRQFYRECEIYGTVDFIFGNAIAVFQNCTIWARKPMEHQKVTITAQSRLGSTPNTGLSIHSCQVWATMDLEASKSSFPTYLGRPWKEFSRVVYMESYLGDHIDPRGWLEWNATSPLDKLYYGEYSNVGPRAASSQRVKWPGIHVNMSRDEAQKFIVAQFILGQDWITATGVSYQAGLTS